MGFTTTAALVALSLSSFVDRGDDDYQFIVGLCDQKLFDLAAKESADFLREHRGHARSEHARYRLATSLFELGRRDEARASLERLNALDGFEFAPEVAFRLGQCELERQRWDAAASAFERALESERDYLKWPATALGAEAHFRAGRYDDAELRYESVWASKDEAAREWRDEAGRGSAWCAFRTERWDACIARSARVRSVLSDPEVRAELDFLIGESELEAGRPQRAIAALERVTSGTYQPAALRSRAFAHAGLEQHARAAQVFTELIRTAPAGPFAAEAALWIGVSWLEAGESARAQAAFADERVPQTAEAELWRARAALAVGQPDAALQALVRAEQWPGARAVRGNLAAVRGEALIALGRGSEAARAFETADDDYGAHAAAIAWLDAGQPEEAVRVARAHLQQRARDDGPYVQRLELALGEALFALQRYEPARQAFEGLLDGPRAAAEDVLARSLSRLGWCHYESQRQAQASAAFERLSREFPEAPEADEALYMWGRAEQDAGRSNVASEVWKRYLAEDERQAHRADCLLGLAEIETGEQREARLSAVAGLVDDERAARALFELAEARAARGAGAAAERAYRRLIEEHAQSDRVPAARYSLAWMHFEADRAPDAIAELERTLAADIPRDLRTAALELKVWCERAHGRPEAAFGAFQELTQLCSDERRIFEAGHATAEVFVSAARADFAVALYDELIRGLDDPSWSSAARVERAYLALADKDRATADRLIEQALERTPDHPSALEASFFVGEAHFDAGDDENAVIAYRRAASDSEAPAAEEALYKLGFTLLRADRPDEAATSFERLAAEFERSELRGESLFLAGEAHFRLGAFESAAKLLQRALEEYPRHATRPKALFRFGLATGELGRWRECDQALTDLARTEPEFAQRAEAELWRGRALAAQGNPRAAQAAWSRVVEFDRGVFAARARISLGRQHRAAGELDAALSEFLKVALLFAQADEVAEALWLAGCTLSEDGEEELANEQFQTLIRDYPESSWAERARVRSRG